MADTQAKAFNIGSVQPGTVLQLLFGHCLLFTVAIISGAHVLPILGACLLSFLLIFNIPYQLHLLEMALYRLARGLPVEPISLRRRWPLTSLFACVNMLGQHSGQQVQVELRNVAYRDQLLQQVGKTAAQEERNRLARDLHDTIKQQLFSIVVSTAAVKARWEHNPASVRTIVEDIEHTALEAQVEMQALLQQLRPMALENVGLIESLRMQCQALGYRTGAEVSAELGDLPPDELLPLGAQEMIFRIVQEGFANIARHARATHTWLSLQRQRDALLVEIGDDGQGFDLAQAHEYPRTYGGMGLSNVRERVSTLGGTVAIWSLPGKGTTLHLCIPLIKQQPGIVGVPLAGTLGMGALGMGVRKVQRILSVGTWAVELAAAFILLYTPAAIAVWSALICIIVACASWFWAQQHRLQISLDIGRTHPQNLLLLAKGYGLLSGVLLLGLLYLNYFVPLYYPFSFAFIPNPGVTLPPNGIPVRGALAMDGLHKAVFNNAWLVAGVLSMFMLVIVGTYLLYVRHSGRYYKTLSHKERQEQLRQQLQQVAIDWLAWAVMVGLTVFLLNVFPSIAADPTVQAAGLVLLCAWFIIMLVRSLRIAHWRNELRRLADTGTTLPAQFIASPTADGQGGSV